MMINSFLGAALSDAAIPRLSGVIASTERIASCDSKGTCNKLNLFFRATGERLGYYEDEHIAVVVRGYARTPQGSKILFGQSAAKHVCEHYSAYKELSLVGLEGSFTLIVMDGQRGRVLLYRNLVGTGFTYYTQVPGGIVFGSNLALLVEAVGAAAVPNQAALASLFLFRYVPGRHTLFSEIYRLMPGELLEFDAQGLKRVQQQSLRDLEDSRKIGRHALDAVEEVMGSIVADYASIDSAIANSLSGGVDSSYIQVLWNQAAARCDARPRSFCITVDHPRTRGDMEYALSAAEVLGTDHTLVPANMPYADLLIESIGSTGELPNHVQAAYFGHLARYMSAQGVKTAFCAEGADSLFGQESANTVHNTLALRASLPWAPLRTFAGSVCSGLGWTRMQDYFRLTNYLYDLDDPRHPVNQQGAFTDQALVEACFGKTAVADAQSARRKILEELKVPLDVMVQLHAINYFTDGIDSCALWGAYFDCAGMLLLCPFMDSRILRLAVNTEPRYRFPFRKPKDLLKRALARHTSHEMAYREKLGFGQPIFEWLTPGGQLWPLVEQIPQYDFLPKGILETARAKPTWFLFSLLCYDLWYKRFVNRRDPNAGGEHRNSEVERARLSTSAQGSW
jgi:asparagine synthase (glutamine-hydrolysing)